MDIHGKDLTESFCYLSRWEGVKIRQGLEPLQELLIRMGTPQNSYPSVIVGGTNGKGSVVAMLTSILQQAGLTVGSYTSPHLFNFNERIRVNSEPISDSEISEFLKTINIYHPKEASWFELVTAMAFVHFQRRAINIAVLEVGLGGRLDATNTARSDLCAITNISLEHQEYLGNTISAIAHEKAGIIKAGGTCVTCERNEEALKLITERAKMLSARVLTVEDDFYFEERGAGLTYCCNNFQPITGIKVPFVGRHQRDNALVAITLSLCMAQRGFNIDTEAIRQGLQKCVWRGRFETLSKKPLVIFDCAHNVAGMHALAATIAEKFVGRRVVAVLGFLRDKDHQGMLEAIAPVTSKIIFTTPSSPRAIAPDELIRDFSGCYPEMESIAAPVDALERACSLAEDKDGVVCIAGSLFLAAPLQETFGSPK